MPLKKTTILGSRDALAKGSFYMYDPDQLKIVTDPNDPLFDPRSMEAPDEALVKSMMKYGFKTGASVEIEARPEGLVVVDGRRRVIAAKEVKRRQIQAGEDVIIRVRCIFSKDKPFVGMVLGNRHRQDEGIVALALKARRAVFDMGQSTKEVAELFGVTTQTISNWLDIAIMPDKLKKAISDNVIPATTAIEIGKMAPEQQDKAIREAYNRPLKGERGKEVVRRISNKEPSGRLSKTQIERFHDALLSNNGDKLDSNSELAIAVLEFVLGTDPTGAKLTHFDPVGKIARKLRED